MKIEKLIKELEKYDPNLEIGAWDSESDEIVEPLISENYIFKENGFDLVFGN